MVVPTQQNDILLPFYNPRVSFTKCQGFNMSDIFHTHIRNLEVTLRSFNG